MNNQRLTNILDPIHDDLDPSVWDNPQDPEPTLRPEHLNWITETINKALGAAGYDGMDVWLSLVFTGSLTTYQYSEQSDVDISLFIDAEAFPDWSRAEMIGTMVNRIDGTKLPGTTHPLQCFVVSSEISKEDLYKPGLRSGYDIQTQSWIVPPEHNRVHDVQKEMNTAYTLALESADKMELLLKYEPQEAIRYWHNIHEKRREDHMAGKGDYSPSNIVYKMLANRGLFDEISEVSGEHIAKFDEYENLISEVESTEQHLKELKSELALKWPQLSTEEIDKLQMQIDFAQAAYTNAEKAYSELYRQQLRVKTLI